MPPARPRFEPGHEPPESPSPSAWWFAFRARELLVTQTGELHPIAALQELGLEAVRTQYLGRLDGVDCYAAELAPAARPPAGMTFRDLRRLYGPLEETLHAVAGRAVQIVEWDRTHQFCGACGEPTQASPADRSRRCTRCGLAQFPRLAPSMIVAVEREDELLLARSPHFPPGIFSVLAGFVEPGESVEEAVVREVWEETGIEVDELCYFGSQPWPFPHSLMLGFQARYRAGEIRVDGVEIEQAGWFPADDMPRIFPGNVSIAQWLIHDFLEGMRGSADR